MTILPLQVKTLLRNSIGVRDTALKTQVLIIIIQMVLGGFLDGDMGKVRGILIVGPFLLFIQWKAW